MQNTEQYNAIKLFIDEKEDLQYKLFSVLNTH